MTDSDPTRVPVPNPNAQVIKTMIALDAALTVAGLAFPGGLAALAAAVLPQSPPQQ